jgi:uncharacterized protein YecT (DUF1311 family)
MALTVLLFSLLILSAPRSASADTHPLGEDDMFCEASLKQAKEVLDQAYADLLGVLNDSDQERLRRGQADWIRFRDADCAFASAGSQDRFCCLERVTEERTADLQLYLAQFKPLSFYSWKTAAEVREKQLLEEHIKGQTPHYVNPVWPDEFLRIADSQYLLAFNSVPTVERRLEYVDLRHGTNRKILEGGPEFIRLLRDKSESKNVLIRVSIIDRFIQWREYYVVQLARSEAKLLAQYAKLAMFWEDSRSGRCDRHSVEFLRLKNAVIPQRVDFTDFNQDGFDDIIFGVLEVDCRTQKTAEYKMVFLAQRNGFVEFHPAETR